VAETTKIQWCHHTFNPWIGCSKVHAGCAHCYAEADMDRRRGRVKWGPHGTRSRTSDAYWRDPLAWDRQARAAGERRRVFCASLADVFEDWRGPILDAQGRELWTNGHGYQPLPEDLHSWSRAGERLAQGWREARLADLRADLFRLIERTPSIDWLLLSKRPENVRSMTYDAWTKRVPGHVSQNDGDGRHWHWPANVWLGTSVSDQPTAAEWLPRLMELRPLVRVLFVSAEPLLGPIQFDAPTGLVTRQGGSVSLWDCRHCGGTGYFQVDPYTVACSYCSRPGAVRGSGLGIDWMIVGGESGPHARPCGISAVRTIVEDCREAELPCFVKQLGGNAVFDGSTVRARFEDVKGGNPEEWPEDLRVREFPRGHLVPGNPT
jgi:protein gp37